jgi:DNA-binding LytR/AlgR family response regulator
MRKKSILIVEDEPIIAADLQDRLSGLGYHVAGVVDTGEEALHKVSEHVPDLVLLDIQLAGKLDGVETALRLRKMINTSLIFLTSNSDDVTFRRARKAQPKAFISKPFRGRDLAHAIELAIGRPTNKQSPETATKPSPERKETAQASQDRLFIKVKDRLIRIMFSDILYLEADDYYCKVYTEDQDYLATKTLKKLSAQFPPDGLFFRCHRSYVVNLNRITEIGDLCVYLNKHKVPLSRSKRAEVLHLVNKL